MSGGRTPGPIIDIATQIMPHNTPRGGFIDQKPVGAKTGGSGGGPVLSGWPRTIRWNEFRDVESRPEGEEEDAQIHTEVVQPERVRIAREDGRLRLSNYRVRVRVLRSGSWVVTGAKSDTLKAHEQGHFDITGLTARDMVAELRALRADSADELQQEVSRIIEEAGELGSTLTEQYDDDTDHGRLPERQQAWQDHLQQSSESGDKLTGPPN